MSAWAVPFMQCFQQMSPKLDANRNQRNNKISDLLNSRSGTPYPALGSHLGVAGTPFFKAAMQTEKRDFLICLAMGKGHEGAKKEAIQNIDNFQFEQPERWSIRRERLEQLWQFQKQIISYNRTLVDAALLFGNKINTGKDFLIEKIT